MANEITVSSTLRVAKGFLTLDKSASIAVDLAGTHYATLAQTIGTTYESLPINGDVASAGYSWFRNCDATNYVEVGLEVSSTFYPLIKLKPGQTGLVPLATTAVFAKANTAAVVLEWIVLEA